jgi:hypothetical protein
MGTVMKLMKDKYEKPAEQAQPAATAAETPAQPAA